MASCSQYSNPDQVEVPTFWAPTVGAPTGVVPTVLVPVLPKLVGFQTFWKLQHRLEVPAIILADGDEERARVQLL